MLSSSCVMTNTGIKGVVHQHCLDIPLMHNACEYICDVDHLILIKLLLHNDYIYLCCASTEVKLLHSVSLLK